MNLLQIGDVIELNDGFRVRTTIPDRFIYESEFNSSEMCNRDVCIGDILESLEPNTAKNYMIFEIGKLLDKFNISIDKTNIDKFISDNVKFKEKNCFMIESGEFIVIDAKISTHKKDYPNEWHVTAQKLNNGNYDSNGVIVEFYQGKNFTTSTNKEFDVIRKLVKKVEFS